VVCGLSAHLRRRNGPSARSFIVKGTTRKSGKGRERREELVKGTPGGKRPYDLGKKKRTRQKESLKLSITGGREFARGVPLKRKKRKKNDQWQKKSTLKNRLTEEGENGPTNDIHHIGGRALERACTQAKYWRYSLAPAKKRIQGEGGGGGQEKKLAGGRC